MKRNFLGGMIAAGIFCLLVPSGAFADTNADRPMDSAFLGDAADKADEVDVLAAKDIALLDDQKLIDTYIDVLVEIEATKTFHSTSGFLPREFKKYKSLLKYRLQLFFEIHRRKLEIPTDVK